MFPANRGLGALQKQLHLQDHTAHVHAVNHSRGASLYVLVWHYAREAVDNLRFPKCV